MLLAKLAKEAEQGLERSVLAHPQEPLAMSVDLVDNRQVLVPSLPEDLVDADRGHARQVRGASPQATIHSTERKTFSHEVRNVVAITAAWMVRDPCG